MFEVIRRVSLVLMWLATGLNVAVMIRGIRLNKQLEASRKINEHIRKVFDGRIPARFCHECDYFKKATANDKGFLICPASGMEITSFDYCSYFEQMKENSDGEESELQETLEAAD